MKQILLFYNVANDICLYFSQCITVYKAFLNYIHVHVYVLISYNQKIKLILICVLIKQVCSREEYNLLMLNALFSGLIYIQICSCGD